MPAGKPVALPNSVTVLPEASSAFWFSSVNVKLSFSALIDVFPENRSEAAAL